MNLLKQLKNFATDSSSSSGVPQNWYITAERAEGLKDKDTFSKSDPYLTIEFGGKSVRTRTIKNDRSPAWNETFNFKLNSSHVKDIHLSLKDDDFGLDDTIGIATISRSELPSFPGEEKILKVPLYREEQVNAIVHLRVKQIADAQSISQSNYQTSNVSSSHYPQQQQQPMTSQSHQHSGLPNQSYNQGQQGYNQGQQGYNQGQQGYNQQQPYNQQQQPYNQQQQPPFYNQNQYPQQQTSSFQPQSQQSNTQFNPNYPNSQYGRQY
jgi:hypothetical protein